MSRITVQGILPPAFPPRLIRRIVKAVLEQEGENRGGTLSIVFLSDEAMRTLNFRYFDRDEPTDVIAFRYEDDQDDIWAEVFVDGACARRHAWELGISEEEEFLRVLIHGVLHVLGYDDETPEGMETMRTRQEALVQILWPLTDGPKVQRNPGEQSVEDG